jgi:pimeloyl-ACP methyl ester carboxylesterase
MRHIETNGVTLAVDDRGDGYPVVFIHGFPEHAYSWRHQVAALSDEGYRTISYDLRGSGGSTGPDDIAAYSLENQVGDVIGILDRLGLEKAAVIGHDWGSIIAYAAALKYPERVSHVGSLNVPYLGWPSGFPTTEMIREHFADRLGYVLSFQEPGEAEARFEKDRSGWLRRILTGVAGRSDFLTEDEFQVWLDAHSDEGLTGQFNLYRNIDRNVEQWASYAGKPLTQRTLLVTVDSDPVLPAALAEPMSGYVTDLEVHHIESCGHWTQQERSGAVNEILSDWLGRVLEGVS